MKKFFTLCSMALAAFTMSAETVTVNVAWPSEPIDATGAEPISLNDGLFQVVGNNSKVTLTASGFYTGGNSTSSARHIIVFPDYDGTLTVEGTASADNTDRYIFVSTENPGADPEAADVIGSTPIPEKGVRHSFDVAVEANSVYFVCMKGNGTITNLTYTYEEEGETPAVEPFVIESVTNQGAAAGVVESLLYQFNVTLPAGYQITEGVVPTLNDIQGSVMPIDETTAAVRFMVSEYYTESGDYTLTLPAGLFTVEGVGNAEYTATWTVEAPAKTPWAIDAVTMAWMGETIEAGAEVSCLSYMYNIVAGKAMVAGEGHIEFVDAEGNGIGVGSLIAEAGIVTFYGFGETGYTTPGTYTLVIPAGAIVDAEGNPCEEYTASWTVVEAPAKTPFDITAVVMNWAGAEIEADNEVEVLSYSYTIVSENLVMGFGEGHVEFVDAEGNGIAVANDVNYGYLKFDGFGEEGYATPGVYTLVIPAGSLVDAEGNPCNEFRASWTVTGHTVALDRVAAEAAAALYNVNGQRVNAAKGMVIMNGAVRFVK